MKEYIYKPIGWTVYLYKTGYSICLLTSMNAKDIQEHQSRQLVHIQ